MSGGFKIKRIRDGEAFDLDEVSRIVGRSDSCDIQVLDGHPSREHARIAVRDGAVFVEDLHSTNGTFVNNKKIITSAVLGVGDVIKFGEEAFSVQSQDAPEATVLMRSLGSGVGQNMSIIDEDDEDDEDSTSFLQMYDLPQGWGDDDAGFSRELGKLDEQKRSAIERYLARFSQSLKGSTGLFMVFFSDENPPLIKSIVVKKDKSQWSLGRSEECDIAIEHPCISKHHATLSFNGDAWVFEDQDSTNGVSLNGKPHKHIQLEDDMLLEMSDVDVLVRFIQ